MDLLNIFVSGIHFEPTQARKHTHINGIRANRAVHYHDSHKQDL